MVALDCFDRWSSGSPEETQRAFEDALCKARAQWPGIDVEPSRFAQYLADRLPEKGSLQEVLSQTCVADVFFACAIVAGSSPALAAFDQAFGREVSIAFHRSRPPLQRDEAMQLVRQRLLVADENGSPRIASYRGQGSLRAWVRVAATRLMVNAAQRAPKEEVSSDKGLEALALEESPELAYLQRSSGEQFKQAFEAAVLALSSREREVLRLSVCEHAAIDDIGREFGVHRATAARWVDAARKAVEKGVRKELRDRLGLGQEELQSVLRVLRSDLDLSLSRILDKNRAGST